MSDRADQFDAVYRENYRAIYAYAYRRMPGRQSDVPDVVADAFLVAWRRIEEVPPGREARLWLYAVALRCVLSSRRGVRRRVKLTDRLTDQIRFASPPEHASAEVLDVRAAIARLRDQDREVLGLVLWEGLSHAEAAIVLECSVNAVAQRLHTARERLSVQLSLPVPDLTVRK